MVHNHTFESYWAKLIPVPKGIVATDANTV